MEASFLFTSVLFFQQIIIHKIVKEPTDMIPRNGTWAAVLLLHPSADQKKPFVGHTPISTLGKQIDGKKAAENVHQSFTKKPHDGKKTFG